MSTQKRASASTSSDQPNQPKRPRVFRTKQERSCLTEEDVRRVIKEELEHAKSHLAKCCQRNCCTGNALEDIVRSLENAVQKLKGALEPANSPSPHLGRANAKSTANNGARNLQLRLHTKLSVPLFTGKKIEGEEGARIYVALIDANTGDVITSGPESSIKLDVVVLEGDFNKDSEDNWAPEEFENYVVKERFGKGPLLAGDLVVKLKGGVGELGELIFTDNSSWNRSKRFRIGVKVASGLYGNTRIQEAKTEAFPVKEHRGEAYIKHYPPAADDEVWRLEKIAKDGKSHQKLSEAGIYNVEDFLLQLFTDPKKLREILGKSIIEKKWDSLICHAKTCKTKWKLYLDYPDGMSEHGAVFNSNGQLIGLIKDRVYFASHQLSAQEKEHGDTIVKKAFDKWSDVREFNDETFSGSMQKKSSSSFPSQVFEGQIGNLTPIQHNLAPRICAAPVGPEAPLANGGSTAESLGEQECCHPVHDNMPPLRLASQVALKVPPKSSASTVEGYSGVTAAGLPTQSQSRNSQNAMWNQSDSLNQVVPSADENEQPFGQPYRSPSTLLAFSYSGITAAGLPTQSQSLNSQNAMWNQVVPSADENVQPFGQLYGSPSSFLAVSTLNFSL